MHDLSGNLSYEDFFRNTHILALMHDCIYINLTINEFNVLYLKKYFSLYYVKKNPLASII